MHTKQKKKNDSYKERWQMLLSALCSELSMYKLINSTSRSVRQPLLVHCPNEEAERLREAT